MKLINPIKILLLILSLCMELKPGFCGNPALFTQAATPQPYSYNGKQASTTKPAVQERPVITRSYYNANYTMYRNAFANRELFKPATHRESSDWVLLRTNMERVANCTHFIYMGIEALPGCVCYAPNKFLVPDTQFRMRQIGIMSGISALAISGVIVTPVLLSKGFRGMVRYNKYNEASAYVVAPDFNNGLGISATF